MLHDELRQPLRRSQLADIEAVVIHRRIYPDALRLSVVSDESCFEVCCQASSRRLWREIKLGDLISALGKWRHANTDSAARCGDVFAAVAVEVREMRHWGVQRCIAAQKRLFTRGERAPPAAPVQAPKAALCSAYGAHEAHGGGDLAALSKRCEAVADLVLEVAGGKDVLNRGSGVVDVAGGTGLLSLALAMRGVRCTVVDPRSSCGCLPSRARKLARKTGAKELVSARRAWFGGKLVGADDAFKGAQDEVPSVTEDCELVRESSALCALHPDEATELVVDTALRLRKPFVVVPCCVFARLFPHRRLDGGQVSSVPDFLSFLQAKHPCIRKVQLPFDGANWALFSAAECGERRDDGAEVDRAHSAILQLQSPVLRTMLRSEMEESKSNRVKLQPDFVEALPQVLRFWYGLPISVESFESAVKLRKLAEYYASGAVPLSGALVRELTPHVVQAFWEHHE
ncbi:unnamed protein product [Effrenium voratum]|nr:unnamed protein product [Effrenium voratum]